MHKLQQCLQPKGLFTGVIFVGQLDAIFVALKLQLQNRTRKLGVIFNAICHRNITGVSNMFET